MRSKKKFLIIGGILTLFVLLVFVSGLKKNTPTQKVVTSGCGDGLCSKKETKESCPSDCDERTCREFYGTVEEECIEKGWKKELVEVDGIKRELLWKSPSVWKNGAIIAMHGGEGTYVLVCGAVPKKQNRLLSDILRGVPGVEFGELAIKEGFAVFSLNSTFNRATDPNGLPIGKRWDSLEQNKENIDLDFIEKVISETIPSLRPEHSAEEIFMTGISNGGFMTVLASTYFSDKVTAFAPVASGDPYGMRFDMTKKQPLRKCGPGTFRDLETNKQVHHKDACLSDSYSNEKKWQKAKGEIFFKQFFHEGDGGVHISCMKKTRELLVKNGYKDAGAFVVENPNGKRTLEKHFWQTKYNQPMLEFFKSQIKN